LLKIQKKLEQNHYSVMTDGWTDTDRPLINIQVSGLKKIKSVK